MSWPRQRLRQPLATARRSPSEVSVKVEGIAECRARRRAQPNPIQKSDIEQPIFPRVVFNAHVQMSSSQYLCSVSVFFGWPPIQNPLLLLPNHSPQTEIKLALSGVRRNVFSMNGFAEPCQSILENVAKHQQSISDHKTKQSQSTSDRLADYRHKALLTRIYRLKEVSFGRKYITRRELSHNFYF